MDAQPLSREDDLYTEVRCLSVFQDSINCLQFSNDGKWLAACGDDGRLAIFDCDMLDDEPDLEIRAAAVPATTLLWHPSGHHSIFVGYSNGHIFLYHIVPQPGQHYSFPSGTRIDPFQDPEGPVEALDYDPKSQVLAAGIGSQVALCELTREFAKTRYLPRPPEQGGDGDGSGISANSMHCREVVLCALHFTDGGEAIIASYVYHGIICWDIATLTIKWRLAEPDTMIARTTISADHRFIAAFNIFNAVACYRCDKLVLSRLYPVRPVPGVPLPTRFIHDGNAILFGRDNGEAVIIDSDDGTIVQTLVHPEGGLIQAIAYAQVDQNHHIIATGSSEQEENTLVKIWRSAPRQNVGNAVQIQAVDSMAVPTATNAGYTAHGLNLNVARPASPASVLYFDNDGAEETVEQVLAPAPNSMPSMASDAASGDHHRLNRSPGAVTVSLNIYVLIVAILLGPGYHLAIWWWTRDTEPGSSLSGAAATNSQGTFAGLLRVICGLRKL